MKLGLHKPLVSTPLGQTVQRFARLPLGQFSTGRSLQRRLSPTLGQKLQAKFQVQLEQNDSIALSESANIPSATAQFVEPFTPELTDSIDRPAPNSSTVNELAPLGNRQPLADRQPLSEPASFLSLKAEPSFDQATPFVAKMGQMTQGATPTPNRIHQQIQTQIQAQFKSRSPAEFTSPSGVRSPQPINPSVPQTSTDTEAESTSAIQLAPEIPQRSIPLQTDIFQPAPVADESKEESTINNAATNQVSTQNSPNQVLQRQVELPRSKTDQAQDSMQDSMQVESIADPAFTVEQDSISTSESTAPSLTNPTATNPTAQASTPPVQRQPDSTSAASNLPEAIAATETTIQRQNELNREQSIELAPNLLTPEPAAPTAATRSQASLPQHSTASTLDQNPHSFQLESEAASTQAISQPRDQLPDTPISDSSINDSIQRSPVQFESAIAPLQPETALEQRLQPDLVEPTRSSSQPSTDSPSEAPPESLSNPPQIQAKQKATIEPEATEAVTSLPQVSTPEAVNAPIEVAIEQPSSDRSVQPPAPFEPQSIAPSVIQPQIEPTKQPPLIQQETSLVLDHSTALEPLSSESAVIQRQVETIEAATVTSSEESSAVIVPSSSDQPGKNSTQQTQEIIQTRQAPEAKSAALPSDITASFDQPALSANEVALPEVNPTANISTTSEQKQIQPTVQEPMLQAKTELAEQFISAIEPSQQQQSARSNLSTSPAVEQSSIDTIQANHTKLLPSHQPLGLAKPIAEPPDLLMPKLDSQQEKVDRQSGFEAGEPAFTTATPNNWSSIDELLDQSNSEDSEAWQQQFDLQYPVVEEPVSPIAKRSPSTPAIDSQFPQANSEQQYTLTSPIATSTPEKEAIDEQQLELFAQLVYGLIRDRLAIEKERYFHTASNHPPWIDIISPEFFKSIKLTAQPNSPNAQQQPSAMVYPPQRQLEELAQAVYQLIQQKLTQQQERSR